MGILGFQLLTDNTIGSALDLRMSPLCSLVQSAQAHAHIAICPIKKVLIVRAQHCSQDSKGGLSQLSTRLLRAVVLPGVYRQNQELSQPRHALQSKDLLTTGFPPTKPGREGTLRQKKKRKDNRR